MEKGRRYLEVEKSDFSLLLLGVYWIEKKVDGESNSYRGENCVFLCPLLGFFAISECAEKTS